MKKGFTLLEIVIAITLLSIITAIVLPSFTNSTDKARLKSDIQSAQIVQSALDLYNIEMSDYISSGTFDSVVTKLNTEGYLKNSTYSPQSKDAVFEINFTQKIIKVNISSTPNNEELYNGLTEQEKYYVTK